MNLDDVKGNLTSFWDNVAEGWRHLWRSAAGALTRFNPGEKTNLPAAADVDGDFYFPTRGWAMLGGEMFEDEQRLVVRLEVPGLEKDDIAIEVRDDALVVSGEKRFERETTDGRWRVMQCAYGSFRRVVPLPIPVQADAAKAAYRNGVLRVDLPKLTPGKPQSISIKID
jgi:HSP20 family protein